MLKMEIKMDRNKIDNEGKYSSDHIYNALECVFQQVDLLRTTEGEDILSYRDKGDPKDYGRFGKVVNTLKRQSWFMDNVSEWILYESDDIDDPEDSNVEDLLNHYRERQILIS